MPQALARPILVAVALVPIATLAASGCTTTPWQRRNDEAPAFITQVIEGGVVYAHNWADRPCFALRLDSTAWELEEAVADRAVWRRGELALAVYLADNRRTRYAVSGMNPEQVLRAYMGYELDFVKPRFEFQVTHPPVFAKDQNGVWMQWGWEGHGGKQNSSRVEKPPDQHHTIASLWIDPWVLSFDWATTDLGIPSGVTPAMIDVIESLKFHPNCFLAMKPGETLENRTAAPAAASIAAGGASKYATPAEQVRANEQRTHGGTGEPPAEGEQPRESYTPNRTPKPVRF